MEERSGFGLAPIKVEGESVPFDGPKPTDEEIAAARSLSYVTLGTGREFYANGGILGLGPDGGLTEGYDGGVEDDDFTPDERRELAEMMIARWRKYGGI